MSVEPTQAVFPLLSLKYSKSWRKNTPKENSMPSIIVMHKKVAKHTTHPQPPSGGRGIDMEEEELWDPPRIGGPPPFLVCSLSLSSVRSVESADDFSFSFISR